MQKKPTTQLSGRASAPDAKINFPPHSFSFEGVVKHYRDVESVWTKKVGTQQELLVREALECAFLSILVYPCASAEEAIRKVELMIADGQMAEWLYFDGAALRIFLSSLVCIQGDAPLPAEVVEFDNLCGRFNAAYALWHADDAEANAVAAETLEQDVIGFPCRSAGLVARKAIFILSHPDSLGVLWDEPGELARLLLDSILHLKGGAA